MITSGHYLHHDYLQPLPTTLDAKQSPLALLAQTCNSIGKDSSSKTVIPPLDKKDAQKDKDAAKGSPALKTEEKSGCATEKKESVPSPKRDSSEDRKLTLKQQRTPSPTEVRSQSSSHINGKSGSPTPSSRSSAEGRGGSSPAARKSSTPSLSLQSNSKISLNCGGVSVEVKHQESLTSSSVAKSSAPTTSTAQPSYADSIAHGTPLHALPGSYHGLSMLGHLGHGPLDAASAAAAAYYASLPPSHGAAYAGLAAAASAQKGAAGLSPYLQYTSVKTASGTTLVPVCKDPYCGQCQAAARTSAHRASCSPGCTQCTTEKSLNGAAATSLHAPTPLGAGLPGLPGSSSSTQQSLLSSLYPHHASSVLPGQHSMPVVCNWLQGTDYCGKVFNSSEELLLHLRSHTSLTSLGLGDVASLPSALPYPNLGLTTAAAAAAHGLQLPYPTQGSRSPNSTLRHAYPRSLSPNGLSALAASRYHPYKSPLGSLSQPSSLSAAAGLPAHLSPYYLPYSLYGQRLGAAMTP